MTNDHYHRLVVEWDFLPRNAINHAFVATQDTDCDLTKLTDAELLDEARWLIDPEGIGNKVIVNVLVQEVRTVRAFRQ